MMLHFYPVCVFCYGKRPGRKAPGPVPLRGRSFGGSSPFYARPDLPLPRSSASCLDLTCAIKMIKSAFPGHKVKRISEAGRFALCCLFSSGRGCAGIGAARPGRRRPATPPTRNFRCPSLCPAAETRPGKRPAAQLLGPLSDARDRGPRAVI